MHKGLWCGHLKERDRRRHRWEDNIKLYHLKEIGWEGMDWNNLAQDTDNGQVLITTERICVHGTVHR
jgi:hypothetical protein